MGNPPKSSELHDAARSGDLNSVQSILSTNPLAINFRDKHSRTPLHLAAWSGQSQVVSYLCNHKADVGAAAMDDMGAIHFAAQKGHLEVVRTLLSSGVSIKALTRKGMTALHYASQGSHLELVKYLVRKGANLKAKTKAGKTPLDLASSEEVRSFLIESETAVKKGDNGLNGKEGDEKSGKAEKCDEVSVVENEEEQEDGSVKKRKGDEDDIKEVLSEPKKARIALNHLLSADDTQEDEENQ